LGVVFGNRRIFDRWEPLRVIEISAAILAVGLNSAVSVIGWALWTRGWIEVRHAGPLGFAVDLLVMTLAMDLGMYLFHRLAHVRWIYPWLHAFHHRHETTNPISLFVLHPAEVIGFGGLMIGFLMIYPMSFAGLIGYLTLNVLFGTLGHSGVEPFPASFARLPFLRDLGTSTFHAGHHERRHCNFGFYTLIWDRLFGTLDSAYERRFRRDP
jgi:sterol desaturase/sphingolipid hydroxylase (fatty acid hydroxylase superfamily)